MKRDDELRKLSAAALYKVANILEINNDWQKVMILIPKNLQSSQFEPKYNSEHMRLIEEHAKNNYRKCAEVLFDEWGTSGRVRPTVDTLMNILEKAQMFRAADELAHILGEPIPHRPDDGPAADITISISNELNKESIEQKLNSIETIKSDNFNSSHDHMLCNRTTKQVGSSNLIQFSNIRAPYSINQEPVIASDFIEFSKSASNASNTPDFSALLPKFQPYQTSVPNLDIFLHTVDSDILQDKNLTHFEYKELETITNRFAETLSNKEEGPVGKIGSGGFGEVFAGTHSKHGSLAVKRVRINFQINCEPSMAMKLFNTEVKSLSYLRHENIVPILGYSIDGPTPCIVCEYIDGGSLQEKIAEKLLTEFQRINIMKGTAEGLKYIHSSERPLLSGSQVSTELQSSKKSYYLHGDVKSANILLTKDCIPKLCDFGLAKQLDTTFITKSMMGTSAYMAPEGFSGTVTQKNDIFSYGIVLLELLTGLKPIVTTDGENINIKNYVEDNCLNDDITDLLDPVVDEWTTAQKIYDLANHCLVHEKNKRPNIDEVCNILNRIP